MWHCNSDVFINKNWTTYYFKGQQVGKVLLRKTRLKIGSYFQICDREIKWILNMLIKVNQRLYSWFTWNILQIFGNFLTILAIWVNFWNLWNSLKFGKILWSENLYVLAIWAILAIQGFLEFSEIREIFKQFLKVFGILKFSVNCVIRKIFKFFADFGNFWKSAIFGILKIFGF